MNKVLNAELSATAPEHEVSEFSLVGSSAAPAPEELRSAAATGVSQAVEAPADPGPVIAADAAGGRVGMANLSPPEIALPAKADTTAAAPPIAEADPVATPVVTISDVVVSEADGTATFVLSLSAPGLQNVTVNYSVTENTADGSLSNDFTPISGTIVFPAGDDTPRTITVSITENLSIESLEAFFVNLSVPAGGNATLAQTSVRGIIVDNDTVLTTPNVAVRDVVVDEKAGVATFVVALDGVRADGGNVSVNYATANGTATAGSDFTAASGTLTFGAGETVKTVQVALTDDLTAENVELFGLNLSGATGATIADGNATARIGASDGTAVTVPVISVSDVVVGEGEGWVDYVLTLSAPGTQLTSVNYSITENTADGSLSTDFTPFAGTVVFSPGVTTQTVRVPISNNAGAEAIENFFFNLTLPAGANATLAQTNVRGMIVDNDTVLTTPNVAVRDVVVDEKAGVATFVVALDGVRADGGNVSVNYATANGTAAAGSDFTAASGTLTFGAGETVKTIQVALTDDLTAENVEKFDLLLSNAIGGQIGDGRGTAVVGANDGASVAVPVLSVANVTVSEGSGWADFTFQLSAPGTQLSSVNYSVVENTADGSLSSDFTPFSGTLTFQPGVTTQTVRVPISNGTTAESLEDFRINLSLPTGANLTLAQTQVVGSIVDDDFLGGQVLAYGLGDDTYVVDEPGDVVVENLDAGTDTVLASITRTLEANVENLTLTGSATIDGTGNELNNQLTGNSANNVLTGLAGRDSLDGGTGADTLVGGGGNDTYTVNSSTDRITEVANAGTDTVLSSVSWTLGTALERLTLTGSNPINGTGNGLANTLNGNAADNRLDGRVGADTMIGAAGNDTYLVDNLADVVTEAAGGGTDLVQSAVSWTLGTALENLTLTGSGVVDATGNGLANAIAGNAAANVIDGKAGVDTLSGGADADIFAFSSAVNGDLITDFVSGTDRLRLDQTVFDIGDGDAIVEGALSRSSPGGFGTEAEFVVMTQDITGAITAASAAAAIGSATAAYALGDSRVFAVDHGSQSAVYRFVAADADAAVSAAELTLIATLSGTASLGTADLLLQPAAQAAAESGRSPLIAPVQYMVW